MATRLANQFLTGLDELRYEPTAKRVRAILGREVALDSTRALLVWEPRRVVPQYTIPLGDVVAELVPTSSQAPVTNERVDVVLDGVRQERPQSPWS